MRPEEHRIRRALIVLAITTAAGCGRPDGSQFSVDFSAVSFVGRDACATCHAGEAAAWAGSHHDLAMDIATPTSVLGDFDDATFHDCGSSTRFFQRDGRFFVETVGPGSTSRTYEVSHTFGFHPLQQYLVPFPDGRKQALTVAWDAERERWFSLHGEDCVTEDDPLHWTGRAMNWNYMCADCHSTGLRRNFGPETNTNATTFAEIDVSCEACHGPGRLHVAWAAGEQIPATPGGRGLSVDLARRTPARNEIETCAPCHSRRRSVYPDFVPGLPYLDHYEPELLEEDLYFPDGQILDEVFVYGSFVQSKMYAGGVRCTDCHDPHTTRLRLEGNALCAQCHEPSIYDAQAHFGHRPGAPGSQCVDCHMTARTYMVVDPRRDHGFKVPRPELSSTVGVPNACNGCHQDRTPEWAAEAIGTWRGGADLPEHPFASGIAAGRIRAPDGDRALDSLVRDRAQPALVRATALHLFRGYGATAVPAARAMLSDEEPLVRTLAIRVLDAFLPPEQLPNLLEPLLTDSTRLVRMEAARVLARISPNVSPHTRAAASALASALEEYRVGQRALSDQAAAHLNLALTYEGAGDEDAALEAYQTALRVDSMFAPAYLNLAMLYNKRRERAVEAGAADEADSYFGMVEESLREAVQRSPAPAEALYTLGLLLAERDDRLTEAAEVLARASAADPEAHRIAYNAGLAYQRLARPDSAESFLRRAVGLAPEEPRYLNALSILYAQEERWDDALRVTRRLQRLTPEEGAIIRRLEHIERRRGSPPPAARTR